MTEGLFDALPAVDEPEDLRSLLEPHLRVVPFEMTEEAWRSGARRWLDEPPTQPPTQPQTQEDARVGPGRGPGDGDVVSGGGVVDADHPAPRLGPPDPTEWRDLACLLGAELASAEDPARAFDLHLAAARVAEHLGDAVGAEAEVAAALDSPGTTSGSARSAAAHRARWCLAERVGRMAEPEALESLQRLALANHPDRAVYRALWAEAILVSAAEGTPDGAASAYVAAVPDGLARALAEAELVWSRPATASAILETAAHRVGGGLGAGLLALAAALTEHAGDMVASAEQRFAAAEMEEANRPTAARPAAAAVAEAPASPGLGPTLAPGGPPAPSGVGWIRDVARLEPRAGLALLQRLIGRLPPSELKVALARWGGELALQVGDLPGAAELLFAPDRELGPVSLALARARLDALAANAPVPSPVHGGHGQDDAPALRGASDAAGDEAAAALLARSVAALAARWQGPAAVVCLAWSAGLWAARRPASRGALLRPILERIFEGTFFEGTSGESTSAESTSAEGICAPSSQPSFAELVGASPALARWIPLAAAFEAMARAAPPDSPERTWWLDLWAAVDGGPSPSGARRASVWGLRQETLAARPTTPGGQPGAQVDALFDELPARYPDLLEGSTLAWQASARAGARGQSARAAAWLEVLRAGHAPGLHGAAEPASIDPHPHPFARALCELASERSRLSPTRANANRPEPDQAGGGPHGGEAVNARDAGAAPVADLHIPPPVLDPGPAGQVGEGVAPVDAARALASWLVGGAGLSPASASAPSALGSSVEVWLAQPGPPAFWSIFAATWASLEDSASPADERACALAKPALADPSHGPAAARLLRRLARLRRFRPAPSTAAPAAPSTSAAAAPSSSAVALAEACAEVEGSAAAWIEAAERHEDLGQLAHAADLFRIAAARLDAASSSSVAAVTLGVGLAADLRFGAFRCGAIPKLWPAEAGTPLSDAECALIDLETLDRAIADGRFEDALGLLVDAPPHENAPTAETWAFAAELARAWVPGKPELAVRLWSRSEDLALRPGLPAPARASASALGDEEGARSPTGRATGALFRLADPGRATDEIRRARAQELLADQARDEPPGDPISAALFTWMGVAGGWTAETDAVELERRLRRSVQQANAVPGAAGGPPVPIVRAWRRWLAGSGRPREAALASAAEAEVLRVPRHKVEALLRAADLETELEQQQQRRARGPASGSGSGPRGGPAVGDDGDPPERSREAERSSRQRDWLREALHIAPDHPGAFERLGSIYAAEGRHRAWSEVLAERLAATRDPAERTALRLARAECLGGPLGDLAGARRELQAGREDQPQHAVALGRLVELEESAENLGVLPDLLRRQAEVEPTDEGRLQVFLKLGRVHLVGATADPARAAVAFERALELAPQNREAQEALSRLRLELGAIAPGLAVTEKLLGATAEPHARARLQARVGRYLVRANDRRGAQLAFRQALATCPTELAPLDELLRLVGSKDAHGPDVAAGRFVLDEVTHRLRQILTGHSPPGGPSSPRDDAAVARALASVLGRRGSPVAAEALLEWGAWCAARAGAATATTLSAEDWVGIFASRPPPPPPSPGHPSRDREALAIRRLAASLEPGREELLFPATVPPAFRQLCRALGPFIVEEAGAELAERRAALGLGRGGRPQQTSKVATRLSEQLAAVLAPGPFHLHLVSEAGGPWPGHTDRGPGKVESPSGAARPVEVLPGKICEVVVRLDRVSLGGPSAAGDAPAGAAERAALRFAAGHGLFLARGGLGFALVGPAGLLAAWITAAVRPFVGDYLHPEANVEEAERWTARFARHLSKHLSKKARHDLAPFALECATELPLGPLRAGIVDAANRVGFIASGSLAVAAELLRPSGAASPTMAGPRSAELAALLELAGSDDLDHLVS